MYRSICEIESVLLTSVQVHVMKEKHQMSLRSDFEPSIPPQTYRQSSYIQQECLKRGQGTVPSMSQLSYKIPFTCIS